MICDWINAALVLPSPDGIWIALLFTVNWALPLADAGAFLLVIAVLVPPMRSLFSNLGPLTAGVWYVLRLPQDDDLRKFVAAIQTRGDNGLAYMDRVIDRQINKARGILPFNSILMTINGLGLSGLRDISSPEISRVIISGEKWIFATAAISSMLLLELFWVNWGQPEVYEDNIKEVSVTSGIARFRSLILDTAIVLSVLCVVAISIIVFAIDRHRL